MRPVPLLPAHPVSFPDPRTALDEPQGLLAAGGALSPSGLLKPTRSEFFRGLNATTNRYFGGALPSEESSCRVNESYSGLMKRLRNSGCKITFDHSFSDVISACADVRTKSVGTWITPRMRDACAAHRSGMAHSVEVWQRVTWSAVYTACLGRMFSAIMFSTVGDGSKLAFYHLNQRLLDWDFTLIDCQMMNPHLQSLGVQANTVISRASGQQRPQQTRLGSWSDLGAEPNENAAARRRGLCMTADSDQEAPLDFYLRHRIPARSQ